MAIEVELRSFITKQKYDELMHFFKKDAKLVDDDYQSSYYFDEQGTLRIQKNRQFSKIWLKKGRLHDPAREEIEIRCKKEDFGRLEQVFTALGFKVKMKWFRKRTTFRWRGVSVMMDNTRGYGHIIELERMSEKDGVDRSLDTLKRLFKELEIPVTEREVFDNKYQYYKKNWKKLV